MKIELLSISWIDARGLPIVDTPFLLRAGTGSWPHKVITGLVATSNPEPTFGYTSAEQFLAPRQYRAALGLSLRDLKLVEAETLIDAGYTPPANTAKLSSWFKDAVPLGDDPTYYPGEASVLSEVVAGKLHGSSNLSAPAGWAVIAGALIKFRAGTHTDAIGIEKAGSPVHVPWVWCEYALLQKQTSYRLLALGSRFPSHAWYVNGQQVGKALQKAVNCSNIEPAISAGQPKDQPLTPAARDQGAGPVDRQLFSIARGDQVDIDVSKYFDERTSPRVIR